MKAKLLKMLGSVRFWQVSIAFMVILLGEFSILPDEIVKVVVGFLGVGIVIRTIDRTINKISK